MLIDAGDWAQNDLDDEPIPNAQVEPLILPQNSSAMECQNAQSLSQWTPPLTSTPLLLNAAIRPCFNESIIEIPP